MYEKLHKFGWTDVAIILGVGLVATGIGMNLAGQNNQKR